MSKVVWYFPNDSEQLDSARLLSVPGGCIHTKRGQARQPGITGCKNF